MQILHRDGQYVGHSRTIRFYGLFEAVVQPGLCYYFRIYGPEGPAFEGNWKPGDFELVS